MRLIFLLKISLWICKLHTNWKCKYLRILWTKAMNIYQFYEWRSKQQNCWLIKKFLVGPIFNRHSQPRWGRVSCGWAPRCPPLACPRADPLLILPRLTQFHSNKHSIAWSETTAAAPNAGLKIWNSTKIIVFPKCIGYFGFFRLRFDRLNRLNRFMFFIFHFVKHCAAAAAAAAALAFTSIYIPEMMILASIPSRHCYFYGAIAARLRLAISRFRYNLRLIDFRLIYQAFRNVFK